MKALLFGAPPDESEVRPTPEDELETMLAGIPFGLHDIDDARLVRPDWVVTSPILSGICGSDAKLVLGDFNTGDIDNPMAAFSSLPHVPGHEVVAEVIALGPEARGLDVGQRVVLNPWLTCAAAGHRPAVPALPGGRPQPVLELHQGRPRPRRARRRHHRRPRRVGRAAGRARLHADPRPRRHLRRGRRPGRSLLGLLPRHRPPSAPASGRVLVYGAGALGLTSVAILHALYPGVEVGVVARFEAQREMAVRFGASAVFAHEPRLALVEALAEWSGAVLHAAARRAARDPSRAHRRRVRLHRQGRDARGRASACWPSGAGSSTPASPPPSGGSRRPIYFKEITIAGSNAFGMEDFEGRRQHAIAHYLQLVADGRLDITPMLTHRFALEEWWPALKALARQDQQRRAQGGLHPQRLSGPDAATRRCPAR